MTDRGERLRRIWARLSGGMLGANRFDWAAPRVAELLGLPLDEARQLLREHDRARMFECAPGVWALPVPHRRGDALLAAMLIEAAPGTFVPHHLHVGDEQVLVLQGGYVDLAGGDEVWRGALASAPAGTAHAIRALEGPACVCLVLQLAG
jgi:quercetin dioxygenase-like cupin family protein